LSHCTASNRRCRCRRRRNFAGCINVIRQGLEEAGGKNDSKAEEEIDRHLAFKNENNIIYIYIFSSICHN